MKIFVKGNFFKYIDSNNIIWMDNVENVVVYKDTSNVEDTNYNILFKSSNNRFTDIPFSSITNENGNSYVTESIFEEYICQNTGVRFQQPLITLDDLNDVVVSVPSNGQVIEYNSTSGKWENKQINSSSVGLGNVPNVDATNPANITQTASYRFTTDTEKALWNLANFIPYTKGNETFRGVNYSNNSTTEVTSGGITVSTTASTIARSVSSTNYASKQIRKGFYGSVVSAGRYTGSRGSALLFYLGSGFKYVCDVYISDTAYGSGCRQFYGMQGSTIDLTYTDTVLVSSLINCIGVGSDSADTNLQVFYNDGTGTASKIDLGANFPANRNGGSVLTTVYSIELFNAPNSSSVLYRVVNKETENSVQGTVSTNLPLGTQGLNFFASRCMGAGVTNTGQFDLLILGVYSL